MIRLPFSAESQRLLHVPLYQMEIFIILWHLLGTNLWAASLDVPIL